MAVEPNRPGPGDPLRIRLRRLHQRYHTGDLVVRGVENMAVRVQYTALPVTPDADAERSIVVASDLRIRMPVASATPQHKDPAPTKVVLVWEATTILDPESGKSPALACWCSALNQHRPLHVILEAEAVSDNQLLSLVLRHSTRILRALRVEHTPRYTQEVSRVHLPR